MLGASHSNFSLIRYHILTLLVSLFSDSLIATLNDPALTFTLLEFSLEVKGADTVTIKVLLTDGTVAAEFLVS